MSKLIVNLGYRQIVLDADKAIALLDLLDGAERYEAKYHSAVNSTPAFNTHHIYPVDPDTGITLTMLSTESYNMYKLAGRPE